MKGNYFLNFKILFLIIVVLQFQNCTTISSKVQLDITKDSFKKLSEYNFFQHKNGTLYPTAGVIPYSITNSMFNDLLYKENFVFLPENAKIEYDSNATLLLPTGSCLINVVYFYENEKSQAKKKHYVETQLLVKKQKKWDALEYIWKDDQSDAELSKIGDIKKLAWLDGNGNETKIEYVFSNKNQCKSCHSFQNRVVPIGFEIGNLNKEVEDTIGQKNQLQWWKEKGIIKNLPATISLPRYADWTDTTEPIFARVQSYLDINCSHCHNANGMANFCGLFLNRENDNMETYGVLKSPTSAGRGSCNLKHDIEPSKPGESIMICRIASTTLGIKMPPLGRTVNDNKGVSLIIEWIAQLKKN